VLYGQAARAISTG